MQIVLQHNGKEVELLELEKQAKALWKSEGHKMKDIKRMKMYVKPEEGMVYFVINDDFKGSISLHEL